MQELLVSSYKPFGKGKRRKAVVLSKLETAIDKDDSIEDKATLKAELKKTIEKMAKETGLSVAEIQKALSEPSALKMLKAFGYSFKTILSCVHDATALIPKGIESAFTALHETKAFQALHKGAVKADELLDKHPVLKKLTGPAVAGLMFMGWSSMSFVGNFNYDFDLSSVADALSGNFSLADTFTSPKGLAWMGLVAAGIASGGMLSVPWIGDNNLPLALAYTGLRKLSAQPWAKDALNRTKDLSKKLFGGLHPEAMEGFDTEFESKGNLDWWNTLSDRGKAEYLKEHPNSKLK